MRRLKQQKKAIVVSLIEISYEKTKRTNKKNLAEMGLYEYLESKLTRNNESFRFEFFLIKEPRE
jgi:hypothetical protein